MTAPPTPYVLGLDLSLTSTGWAKLDTEGQWETGRIHTLNTRSMGERLSFIRMSLATLMDPRKGCARVGYEDLPKRSIHGTVATIAQVHAVLHLLEADLGWQHTGAVNISSAKKLATGRGNASKEEMLSEAIRRLGYSGSSPDEADALWVASWTALAHEFPYPVKLPVAHLAALTMKPAKKSKKETTR